MTGDELKELKDDLVDVARGKYPAGDSIHRSRTTPTEDVLKRILCIHQAPLRCEVIEKYVRIRRSAGC